MAYGNPGPYGGGPAAQSEDYFSDTPAAKEPMQGTKPEEGAGDKQYGETAIIPKAILGGKEFKPGEEVVLQVVAIHGDRVEVKYAAEPAAEQTPPKEAPMPAAAPTGGGGDREMAAMMQ
jgi:hypothetical protein